MKFCTKCGKKLEENAVGCPNCNSTTDAQPTPAEVPASAPLTSVKEKLLGNKKILIGGIAVVVAAIVVLIIVLVSGGGYKKAVERYINLIYLKDITEDDIRLLAPESLWEEWADDEGYRSVDAMFEEWIEDYEEELEEFLEELDDFEMDIDYEIKYEEELSERELDELCEALEDRYDMNYSDFTEGYTFKLEVSGYVSAEYQGEELYEEIDDKITLTAVKMNGEWYLVNGSMWWIDNIL